MQPSMRFNFILLFISLALLASCGAAFEEVTTSDLTQSVGVAASDNRSLRTAGVDDVDVDDEERGLINKIPSAHVAKLVRGGKLRTLAFQDWMKANIGITDLRGALTFKQSRFKWLADLKNANNKKLLNQYKVFLATS
ncbi:hypothetical protein PRIC1_004764 [Phytophthora ramorum]